MSRFGTGRFLRKAAFGVILALALGVNWGGSGIGGTSVFAAGFLDEGEPDALARSLADGMSDADALAQTFMLGWRDAFGGEPSALIRQWISERHIGGVKVFGWNTADTLQLARNIGGFQGLAEGNPSAVPLLVATDQEGGLVRHVKGETRETPSAMAIGASGYPEDAYRAAFYIGRELSALGINMNFAPTVDLYTNHGSVLIGTRSFGDNPQRAGLLGAAFAKGLLASGIIPTAKHFPGHGDTALDSHGVLPSIDAPFEVLWERELVPYRMLARENIPAVMSGHIAFPATEAGRTPASLSAWFLTDVLRRQIGFEGLLITDDLMMNGAVASAGSLSLAAKQALLAGNDIIMLSSTPALDDPVWVRLLADMGTDAAFRERVRDAARRVLAVKLRHLRGAASVPLHPDPDRVRRAIPDKEGEVFFRSLAARSVTLVKNEGGVLPLKGVDNADILLAGQSMDFFNLGKRLFPGAKAVWYAPDTAAVLQQMAGNARVIIFYLSSAEGVGTLRRLRPLGKTIIVLSVLSPAYLEDVPWVDAALAVYGDNAEKDADNTDNLAAGFSAIAGRIPAAGTLPFKLE